MADSFVQCYVHYVFSTKGRVHHLYKNMRPDLFSYIGGIARKNDMKAITVGGVDDHVHILASIPSTLSISEGVKRIKGGTSKWITEDFDQLGDFSWQKGYAAFSVSHSNISEVKEYIENQEQHHKKMSFVEEYKQLLERHEIDFDTEYLFG